MYITNVKLVEAKEFIIRRTSVINEKETHTEIKISDIVGCSYEIISDFYEITDKNGTVIRRNFISWKSMFADGTEFVLKGIFRNKDTNEEFEGEWNFFTNEVVRTEI